MKKLYYFNKEGYYKDKIFLEVIDDKILLEGGEYKGSLEALEFAINYSENNLPYRYRTDDQQKASALAKTEFEFWATYFHYQRSGGGLICWTDSKNVWKDELSRRGELYCDKGHKMTMCYIPVCACTKVTAENICCNWITGETPLIPKENWKHLVEKWLECEGDSPDETVYKFVYKKSESSNQYNYGSDWMIINIDISDKLNYVYWSSIDDDIMFTARKESKVDIELIKSHLENIQNLDQSDLEQIFKNLGFEINK